MVRDLGVVASLDLGDGDPALLLLLLCAGHQQLCADLLPAKQEEYKGEEERRTKQTEQANTETGTDAKQTKTRKVAKPEKVH